MAKSSKKWYLSKTVWLGILAIATAGVKTAQLGGDWMAVALACFGVATIVIRSITDAKLIK